MDKDGVNTAFPKDDNADCAYIYVHVNYNVLSCIEYLKSYNITAKGITKDHDDSTFGWLFIFQ